MRAIPTYVGIPIARISTASTETVNHSAIVLVLEAVFSAEDLLVVDPCDRCTWPQDADLLGGHLQNHRDRQPLTARVVVSLAVRKGGCDARPVRAPGHSFNRYAALQHSPRLAFDLSEIYRREHFTRGNVGQIDSLLVDCGEPGTGGIDIEDAPKVVFIFTAQAKDLYGIIRSSRPLIDSIFIVRKRKCVPRWNPLSDRIAPMQCADDLHIMVVQSNPLRRPKSGCVGEIQRICRFARSAYHQAQ